MLKLWLVTAALFPCLAQAASFQTFDMPGATTTCGVAIASNGLVAGISDSGTLQSSAPFLYAAGRFSKPKVALPLGDVAVLTGVNARGVTTLLDFTSNISSVIPYVDRHGVLSTPNAGGHVPNGFGTITDRGVLLGSYRLSPTSPFSLPRTVSFVQKPDGTTKVIDDGSSLWVNAVGMDARADKVVGTSIGSVASAWLFSGGVFTPVAPPFAGVTFTFPTGVTNAGLIVGSYLAPNASGVSTAHGFVLDGGTYTSFDVPKAGVTSTSIGGINEARQITGCYTDARGKHGYIRTP